MNLEFKRRTQVAFLWIALIPVALAAAAFWLSAQFREDVASVAHTYEVRTAVRDIDLLVTDAEASLRQYLFTGQGSYRRDLDNDAERARQRVAEVRLLTVDNPSQQQRIRLLQSLVETELSELQRLEQTPRQGATLNPADTERRQRSLDQIRDLTRAMAGKEQELLDMRARRGAATGRLVLLIFAAAFGLTLLLLVWAARLLRSYAAQREQAEVALISSLHQVVALNRDLERRVEERTAELRQANENLSGLHQEAQNARDSLKTTLSSIGDAVVSTDSQGRVVFVNPVAQSLLQLPEGEILGKPLDDVFHIVNQVTRATVESPVNKVLREGAIVGLANHTVLIASDGTEIPIDDSGAPVRSESGALSGVVLVFRDVTERRQAERNALLLASIVESSEDAIVAKSIDGIIQSWNEGAHRLYGYTAGEILGHHVNELVPEDRWDEESNILAQLRAGHRVEHFETVRLRKDGTLVDVSLSISPMRDADGTIIGASHVARDITEQKKRDAELRSMQKLESLGVLAGGIAHDFNNLLVGILGNASLALERIPLDSDAREPLNGVVSAGERAAELTRQMLAYSGKGRFVVERIELSAYVREILPLIQVAVPRTVELRLDLGQDLPAIEADTSQLQQLVMNLAINGAEAVPAGRPGTVTISTSRQEVNEHYLETHSNYLATDLKPGTYVLLEVRDTGTGMDEETKARIFDPFFTTKFTGRGLGLAAVLGIVRGHSGAICLESAPGRGTVFDVLLPAMTAKLERQPRSPREDSDLTGSGIILVIDDEQIVRTVAQQALERYGYKVLLAENGEQGLEIFRRHAGEIKCVVLDMTMPVMSGEATFEQLKALRGDVPVILSSGYNEVEAVQRFEGQALAGFIQKPYRAATLARKVKEILRRTSAASGD